MNIVLFEPSEIPGWLPAADVRALHIEGILKLVPGDRFSAGVVGGPWGTLGYLEKGPLGLRLGEEDFDQTPRPLSDVRLLVGTPRPPTARRLLKDLTTLGAREIHFVATDLGDKSYLQSTLWKDDWREALKEGAAQNRNTLLPAVERHTRLRPLLESLPPGPKVVFDEGGAPWNRHANLGAAELWLAIGPERGWSRTERELFGTAGWSPASLGSSVLRTETACALALGMTLLARRVE